jgi:multidrug efflux pump subunit AcrB
MSNSARDLPSSLPTETGTVPVSLVSSVQAVAFWVTVGIPTAFLGTFLFLPFMDVSINIVSLFAFIIALGLVVDDAIIAGENIYEYRQRGLRNT